MKLRAILFLITMLSMNTLTWGQGVQDRHWAEEMKDVSTNFYDVQAAFNEHWEGKEITKGQGYKQYKRWEYFWEQRLFPSGDRVAPDHVYKEIQKSQKSAVQLGSGVWTYFGNTSIPTNGGGAGRINMVRTDPNNPNTYFACAPGGGLWRSTNAGVSWGLLNTDDLSSIGVSDVAVDYTDSDIIYMGTGDGDAGDTYALGVLKSVDGGVTWNTTGLSWTVQQTRRVGRLLMHPSANLTLIAATNVGMQKTTDGGTSWTQTLSGNFKDVEYNPSNPQIVYCVGNTDEFYRSTDGGDSWTQITSGLPTSGVSRMALSVTAANANYTYMLVGGSDQGFGGFYHSSDAGLNWTLMVNSPNMLGWNTDGSGTGGQAWYDLAIAADPLDADVVYIGGVNVWKTSDAGANWDCVGHWYGAGGTPYVHADIHGMHFVPGTSTLLVGCDGGVFRSTDGGNSFQDLSANLEIAQMYRLGTAQTNVNKVITGWQDNGTNFKNGSNWSRVIGGDGFESAIDYTNENIQYGALYYGQIFRSTGGGFNTILNSGGADENQNGAWLTPYILSPNDPNTIYVGKSGVYKSTDSGSNWTTIAELGGGDCNALAVAPSNEDYIYASKSGTLYRSTDGATFTQLTGLSGNYITYIAIDPLDETRLWVTFSGFGSGAKVYFSDDAGDSWSDYSTGLPAIPANCIVYQDNTNDALYLGTDAGVYYRDQTFGSWQLYNDGLPNVVVSELEIHYSSNTLVAATYGRGLWHAPLYVLPQTDAAIIEVISPSGTLCDGNLSPQINIGNYGVDDITTIDFEYSVDGSPVLNYTWTGLLATAESQVISLPSLAAAYGAHAFDISIVEVNGVSGDDNALNDAKSDSFFISGNDQTITFNLTTDCWATETSWEVTDSFGTVVHQGSGYTNYSDNAIDLCLLDGCYTLTVYDSYGDGLSGLDFGGCSQNGDFNLVDAGGFVLAQMINSSFGFSESHTFCIPAVVIPGCTDPWASNYDSTANSDDGSCIFTCTLLDINFLTDCWGGEVSWDVVDAFGNVIASGPETAYDSQTNYTEIICLEDGCYDFNVYDEFGDGLAGIASGCAIDGDYSLVDEFGNVLAQMGDPNYGSLATHNICLPFGIEGCTDTAACNYDSTASVDNGTCSYPGCMDSQACNYSSSAGCDDGSCSYPGCTDLVSCNYNAIAGCDDGSCTYPGCQNTTACNFNPAAGCNDGSCVYPGCNDSNACNFNASAGCDDGSCTYPGCNDSTACNFNNAAGCDDGSCDYSCYGCTDSGACNFDASATIADGSCEYITCAGCTNTMACNYDSTATIDDGSCTLPGCNDSIADNYDSTAGCDDGSCTYNIDCSGDFNMDGEINVQDLLILLGTFGCEIECGEQDLNNDGLVNTNDMLLFLGLFGQICP